MHPCFLKDFFLKNGIDCFCQCDLAQAIKGPLLYCILKVLYVLFACSRSATSATLLEVIEDVPKSTRPHCPHFSTCGGCVVSNACVLYRMNDLLNDMLCAAVTATLFINVCYALVVLWKLRGAAIARHCGDPVIPCLINAI